MIEINKIYNEDCLEGMKRIPDKSVDMILCDLPYQVTDSKWDVIIPFDLMWERYKRVIKDDGAIVLFGTEPFSSFLRMSNIKNYKYDWVWNKRKGGNIFNLKSQPYKIHENIMVFNSTKESYYPIMEYQKERTGRVHSKTDNFRTTDYGDERKYNKKYPKSILDFSNAYQKGKVHPTQKPVPLFEYLIKTYTDEGETVLDNCIGSGTTAIACLNTERNFIGFELNKEYFEIAQNRIEKRQNEISLLDVETLEVIE